MLQERLVTIILGNTGAPKRLCEGYASRDKWVKTTTAICKLVFHEFQDISVFEQRSKRQVASMVTLTGASLAVRDYANNQLT